MEAKRNVKKLEEVLEIYVDGELIGYADSIMVDAYGAWFLDDGAVLSDNGEPVNVGDFNVTVK